MFAHVSTVGVVLAALSAMVIGTVWYSKALFGAQWQKIMGTTDKEMKQKIGGAMVTLVIVSLVTAYVLALFMVYFHSYVGGSWWKTGVDTALLAWVGIGATAIVAHGVFDNRDKSLMVINAGNRLATLLAMGLIIAAFMK